MHSDQWVCAVITVRMHSGQWVCAVITVSLCSDHSEDAQWSVSLCSDHSEDAQWSVSLCSDHSEDAQWSVSLCSDHSALKPLTVIMIVSTMSNKYHDTCNDIWGGMEVTSTFPICPLRLRKKDIGLLNNRSKWKVKMSREHTNKYANNANTNYRQATC